MDSFIIFTTAYFGTEHCPLPCQTHLRNEVPPITQLCTPATQQEQHFGIPHCCPRIRVNDATRKAIHARVSRLEANHGASRGGGGLAEARQAPPSSAQADRPRMRAALNQYWRLTRRATPLRFSLSRRVPCSSLGFEQRFDI